MGKGQADRERRVTGELAAVRCVHVGGVLWRTQPATARKQQHMGSTANSSSIGNLGVPAVPGTQNQHAPSPAHQPPVDEPTLSRTQLDARFEKVERDLSIRRREAVEDARERRYHEPAGTVRRRLVFD